MASAMASPAGYMLPPLSAVPIVRTVIAPADGSVLLEREAERPVSEQEQRSRAAVKIPMAVRADINLGCLGWFNGVLLFLWQNSYEK